MGSTFNLFVQILRAEDTCFAFAADWGLMQAMSELDLKEMLKFQKVTAAVSQSAIGCSFMGYPVSSSFKV